MKYTITNALTLICLLLAVMTHAQAPLGIPYQAVARNSSGAILASTNISARFTIRDSIATGTIKYQETHSVTTTAQGMFSVTVGQGTVVAGTFAGINWGKNAKFMQAEIDPAGGSSYLDMGTQQMMSVPYAMSSKYVKLKVSTTGDTLYTGGGNYVVMPGISAANNPPDPGIITGVSTLCAGSSATLTNTVSGGSWSSANASVATISSTGIVTGVAAGTTTISYIVTNSFASSYATMVITVIALPSAGTITGIATVTAGSTTTLSNATTGGTWSSGATDIATVSSTGIVSSVAAGTAIISYTVTVSGCSAVATKVVTVNATLPTITTTTVGSIVSCAANSGGTISSGGGVTVTARGVVWSSSPGPTVILTTKTNDGTGTGTFTSSMTGLTASTTYYVRAYATNSLGTSYGTEYSFTTLAGSMCIGSAYGGGIIAYILQPGDSGYVSTEIHGLIAAPSDQSTGIVWGPIFTYVGGTSTAFGTGNANTNIVSAALGAGTAARLCADLVLGGYSDWYLPSLDELQKLAINSTSIGGFSTGVYTSSSEMNDSYYWRVNFPSGGVGFDIKTSLFRVRAVRSF